MKLLINGEYVDVGIFSLTKCFIAVQMLLWGITLGVFFLIGLIIDIIKLVL